MVVSNLENLNFKSWHSSDLRARLWVENGVENVIVHENVENFENHLELILEAS